MGKQLFIVKAGATPADGTALASIAAGKAGIVVSGASVTEATPTAANLIQVVSKRLDGSPEITPIFSAKDIVKKSVIAPSAGTVQASHITFALGTQAKNIEFIVKIIDTTPGTRAPETHIFSVFHIGTDFTATSLVNAFVAKINAANIDFTASNDADKLKIVGDNTVKTFRLAVDGHEADQAVITYTTPNMPAAGTPDLIRALEKELNSFGRGITNRMEYPVKEPVSQVDNAATYTLYVFDIKPSVPNYAGTGYKTVGDYKLYIAEADALPANHIGKVIADLV